MDSERKIEVEFESNESDFQRALLWYHWKRMTLEISLMIIIGIIFCYFLGFNVLDIRNNGFRVFVFVTTILILAALDVYGRCFLRANKLKAIAKPARTIFTEQGIESKTSTTNSSRDWENYSNIYETAKDFIFFSQENVFASIPKRFFKSRAEIDALRDLVNRKLGYRAKLQN